MVIGEHMTPDRPMKLNPETFSGAHPPEEPKLRDECLSLLVASLPSLRGVCQRMRLTQRKVEPENEEKMVSDGIVEQLYSALLGDRYPELFPSAIK